MDISRVALICIAGIITASCSEKSAPDRANDSVASETHRELARKSEPESTKGESKLQTREDQIGEDCVAFVRSTTDVPAQSARADCPGCSTAVIEMLAFRKM